jgi:hypothetical protein
VDRELLDHQDRVMMVEELTPLSQELVEEAVEQVV